MLKPSERRLASRTASGRVALSLIVGFSPESQISIIKFRFIRGLTETIHLPSAVALALLDGLRAAETEKAEVWSAASALNANAERLLSVVWPRFTDADFDAALVERVIGIRLGVADIGAAVEFTLSTGATSIVGFTPIVAASLLQQLQACEPYLLPPGDASVRY